MNFFNLVKPKYHLMYFKNISIKSINRKIISPKNNDPMFVFRFPRVFNSLRISTYIYSDIQSDVYIYYSKRPNKFSEDKCVKIGKTNDLIENFEIKCVEEVRYLRLDPVCNLTNFSIQKFVAIPGYNPSFYQHSIIDYSFEKDYNNLEVILKNSKAKGELQADKVMLLFTHEMTNTGAPLLCSKISEKLMKLGYFTVIISPIDSPNRDIFKKSCNVLLSHGINESNIKKTFSLLQSFGANKCISNTVLSGRYSRMLSEYHFKNIVLIHEMKSSCEILNAGNFISLISDYADVVVFPAACVKDDFLLYGNNIKGKTALLPQGYYKSITKIKKSDECKQNLIKKLNLPSNTVFLIGAGSVNFGKGVDLIPLFLNELIKKEEVLNVSFHFIWLGATNSEQYNVWLVNQIKKMGLENRIHFTGFIGDEKDYLNYLAGSELFILTSREDSMPSVVFEAMSVCLPVVGFKKSGGVEYLLSEERGFLIDYIDLPSLCSTVMQAITNPEYQKEIAGNAFEAVGSQWSFDNYVNNLLQFFYEV